MQKTRVATNIRRVMNEKDLKPRDVMRMVSDLGYDISNSALSNYLSLDERNVRTPDPSMVLILAKGLGVKLGELYGSEFIEHDLKVDRFTNCGELAFTDRFNIGENVEHHIVTDSSNKPFKPGDCLVIDKDFNEVSSGYYSVLINNMTQIRNLSFNGESYMVDFGNDKQVMALGDVTVIGKVVAKFTTQF